MSDLSVITSRATVTVFHDTVRDRDALVARLHESDALCVMSARTPLPRALLERLPRLRLIVSTCSRNASIEEQPPSELGIELRHTGYSAQAAIKITWAPILAGSGLQGKTLAVLGLARIGSQLARIAQAFAWR